MTMHIGVIGINHKSADLALREEIARICGRCFGLNGTAIEPIVVLSTCNRTELYFSSEDLAQTHSKLLNILRQEIAFPFEHKVYSYFGKDCFFHLAAVTAGLDSAMIGESEIQGQVKKAYEEAIIASTLAPDLHFLFQKSLKIGKEVRSKLSLYHSMPTLEESIHQAAKHLLGPLFDKKILLIGLSEINLKIYKYFKKRDLNLTFCNRTFEKLKNYLNSNYLLWEEFHQWPEYDLVIFGTKSPNYLLTIDCLPLSMMKQRLLIDLSVPRNVDPRLGKDRSITLLNVDQLMRGVNRRRKIRGEEIVRYEKRILSELVDRQLDLFSARAIWKKGLKPFSQSVHYLTSIKTQHIH